MTGTDWLWSSGLFLVIVGALSLLVRWVYGTWRWW